MFSITKTFKFEAAHRLHALPKTHQCSNIHGHSYRVDVSIYSNVLNPATGFVIDFGELKGFKEYIDTNFDHAIILADNDPLVEILKGYGKIHLMKSAQTSAEEMAKLFAEHIYTHYGDKVTIFKVNVKVWETENNCAEFELI